MTIANWVLPVICKQSARRFEEATRNPVQVQEEKLLAMARLNANTEYGKRYGFSSIATVKDYQRQVPVVTFEDIKDDMKRVFEGERNIFTTEAPLMFAQTSGTTGDSKFIPVTKTCKGRDHSDVMRTWLYHANKAHPGIFSGKVLALVSPAIEGYSPKGLPYGSTSGQMYKSLPGVIARMYSAPYEVFEIQDYDGKYYALMRIAIEQNVLFANTANPSSILKLCQKGNEFGEEIIKDIHDGTLSDNYDIEPENREAIQRWLRPNPRRAAALSSARGRRDGRLLPRDYWPDLILIGCWKGGTVGHYLDKFGQWFDPDGERPVPVRDWGYLASEMRGSVPLSDEGSKGVLTVDSNFYEFVEESEVSSNPDGMNSWNHLTVGEVEEGKEYYIFVTTSAGLYRYDINDVIQVVGKYNETPEIVFLRKGRGMANITGEKVSVNQIIHCFESVSKQTGVIPTHFKAEADTGNSRYVFRIELVSPPVAEELKGFLTEVDLALKAINIEYKAKRESGRLGDPVLHVMRDGWYERHRQAQVAEGKRVFQAKTEILSPMKQATFKIKPELAMMIEMG